MKNFGRWAACGIVWGLALQVGLASEPTRLVSVPSRVVTPMLAEPDDWLRPVTMTRLSNSQGLLIGDRTGRLHWFDSKSLTVRARFELESQGVLRLESETAGERVWLVTEHPHQLAGFTVTPNQLTLGPPIELRGQPWGLSVSQDGTWAAVSLPWRREIVVARWRDSTGESVEAVARWQVPFEPGELIWLDERQVLVAEAFGGRVLWCDGRTGAIRGQLELDGHNLRGLSRVSGQPGVFVTHSRLDQQRPITRVAIEFGDVMKHRVAQLVIEDGKLVQRTSLELGFTGFAATDPGQLTAIDERTLAVLLEGVDELSILDLVSKTESRMPVGDRPVAVEWDQANGDLWVLSEFDATLRRIDVRRQVTVERLALGGSGPQSAEQRGERLFFDAQLARDRWMSCHSCHTLGHTNRRLADTLGDGTHGTPKRTLSLLGVTKTPPWGWTGTKVSLEQQVEETLRNTLHTDRVRPDELADLVAYLRSLSGVVDERADAATADRTLIARGKQVFEAEGCRECHQSRHRLTSLGAYDVGLVDEAGLARFNPPSLHGVGRRDGWFHDRRAASLHAVFSEWDHGGGAGLAADDLEALLAYLRDLN